VVVLKICLGLPLPGEMIQSEEYFSNGLKPPTSRFFAPKGKDRKVVFQPSFCRGKLFVLGSVNVYSTGGDFVFLVELNRLTILAMNKSSVANDRCPYPVTSSYIKKQTCI